MRTHTADLVLCIKNTGFEASLERRKLYRVVPDKKTRSAELIRVIDESGDSYLYPHEFFASIKLPAALRRVVLAAG
jgi:hypothetical protein